MIADDAPLSTGPPLVTGRHNDRYRHGLRALGALATKSAAPALRKRGFGQAEIITRWEEIVTPALARETSPEKLSFPRGARMGGTLTIRAPAPLALELQHLEPVLLERINTFFGYRAVDRIALLHGAVTNKNAPRQDARPAALDETAEVRIESQTKDIHSEPLREALRSLGKTVKSKELGQKSSSRTR